MFKQGDKVKHKKRWSDKEDNLLRRLFPDSPTKRIAKRLRRSYGAVALHAAVLGLRKSEAYLSTTQNGERLKISGKAFRFPKGLVPWNKGKKYNPGGRSIETRFKKGRPFKGKAVYLYTEKNGNTYKFVRTAPGVRQPLQRVVWEKNRGAIPRGHIVAFRNGNTLDCRMRNLKLLSRADNLKRNSVRYPKEINQVVRTLNKLKNMIVWQRK